MPSREVPWKSTSFQSQVRPSRFAKSTMASWQQASGCAQAGDRRNEMPSALKLASHSCIQTPIGSMTHTRGSGRLDPICFARSALSTAKPCGPAPTIHTSKALRGVTGTVLGQQPSAVVGPGQEVPPVDGHILCRHFCHSRPNLPFCYSRPNPPDSGRSAKL